MSEILPGIEAPDKTLYLDYALHLGANIPETHYLLKITFDDGLHWNFNRDNTIPIVAKLSNPILHKLITEVVVRYREIS